MAPPFVIYPHPALSRKALARPLDEPMIKAGAALLKAAEAVRAYGLAAAHLGLDEPIAVVSFATNPQERDYRLLFNPRIVELAEEVETGTEGSVSLPGIEVPVQRPVRAVIGFQDAEGREQVERLEGFVARVAQHEIEQVEGIFFLRRVSSTRRDAALRRFRKNLLSART